MANEMVTVDKNGEWFTNIGQFRMVDPTSGHFFEPQVKYKIDRTEWIDGQPTIVETDMEEDVTGKVVVPKRPNKTSLPKVEREPEPDAAKK